MRTRSGVRIFFGRDQGRKKRVLKFWEGQISKKKNRRLHKICIISSNFILKLIEIYFFTYGSLKLLLGAKKLKNFAFFAYKLEI